MDDNDPKYAVPTPMTIERRRPRTVELNSSEVMRILRRRAAKAAARRKAEEAVTEK